MLNRIKNFFYQLLKKTEKYTETDMIYLAKGGFWLVLGQVIPTMASFLLSIAFANLLDPVTFGNYQYVLSIIGILGVSTLAGMGTAITQAVSRGMEGAFYSGFKTKFKWGLLGSISAIGLAIYYWFRGNSILPIPLLLAATFLPLMEAPLIYGDFLVGKKLFSTQAKYSILTRIIYAISLISILLITKNLFLIVAIYLVVNTFLNYFFYRLIQYKLQPNKKEDPTTLSYGKHLSLMNFIGNISSELDRLLTFHYLGAAYLSIYNFAVIIPDEVSVMLGKVNTLAFPKLSAKSREEIQNGVGKKFWKMFIPIFFVIAVYIILSPFFYRIFWPKYLAAVPYSQLYIFSLLSVPSGLLLTALRAKVMIKELYQFKTVSPFIKIILCLILIPRYGLWGLIMIQVITEIFNLGLAFYLFKKNIVN